MALREMRSRYATRAVEVEANASTDNPMVFAETGDIVSGGNFHGAPVAIAADLTAIAMAHLTTISERRVERLVNPVLSGLPAFLTEHGGLESGLMLAQVTAAALTSEVKTLVAPGLGRHHSDLGEQGRPREHEHGRGAQGRRRGRAGHARASPWSCCCAARAIDLLAPLTTSPALQAAHARLREVAPRRDHDHPPSADIEAIAEAIAGGAFDHVQRLRRQLKNLLMRG